MTDFDRFNMIFDYNPETGILTCRGSGWRKSGVEAGGVVVAHRTSYRRVMVENKKYQVHRVVWLLMTGEWPQGQIDHKDGDGLNNRFSNLKDVTGFENCRNRKRHSNNTSGITGVCWHKCSGKWLAQIRFNGKHRHLGLFDSMEDAVAARQSASEQFGFSKRHGTIS